MAEPRPWERAVMPRLPPPPLPPAHQLLADQPPRLPDQARYGPTYPRVVGEPHERDGVLLYVNEGTTPSMEPGTLGWSVNCACGWCRWSASKAQVKTWGEEHIKPGKKGDGVTYACPVLRKESRHDG